MYVVPWHILQRTKATSVYPSQAISIPKPSHQYTQAKPHQYTQAKPVYKKAFIVPAVKKHHITALSTNIHDIAGCTLYTAYQEEHHHSPKP